jgi:hypothetical protein
MFCIGDRVSHGEGHGGIRAPIAPREYRALLLSIALLLSLAAGMGWLVRRSVAQGQAPLPSPRATLRRAVIRDVEPTMFRVAIGLYGTIGAGALVLAVLGVRVASRPR